jgi:hypothetical protein
VTEREVRHFAVYLEGRLVLVVRANPGTLRSSAGPPPGGAPPPPPPDAPGDLPPGVHPFIDAQAHDPVTEGRLRKLLDASSDFDDYLARLIGEGFDIASEIVHDLPGGVRLYDGDTLVGAAWPRRGQFTSLRHQPAEGELLFDRTVTAYDEERSQALLDALEAGDLERLRLRTVPIPE